MEGVPPSFMDDDDNQLNSEMIAELLLSPPEVVPVNQSSMLFNDQARQNSLMGNDVDSIQQTTQFPTPLPDQTMTTMGGLDGTSSSCINQNGPNWPQTPSSDQQWANQLAMSNQVPGMLPQPPMNQWHQNSFIHQPQQGDVYMTPNATTSQHGGFNQPAPRIQYFPNQGQVNQASVIPHIDNMQQDNLVALNFGRSTGSQMENPQVHALQNQNARPNTSNPGPDSSLQSQNRGLNTQQVQRAGPRDPFWNYVEEKDDGSMKCSFCPHTYAIKTSISRIKWHLSGEKGHNVKICGGVTEEVQEEALKAMHGSNKRHKSTASSINVNDHGISTCPQEQNIENENIGGDNVRVQREDRVVEASEGEERISSYAVAGNNIVSMTGMRAQEDRVSEGALESRLMTEPVDRELEQSNLAGTAGRTQVGVQGTEEGAGEERIQSHSQAENAMEDTVEGSFMHDGFQTIRRTEQVQHLERHSSCERQSINQADEPRGDSSQPSDPLCPDYGRYYDQPFAPSVSNDVIMNDVRTEPVEEHDVVNAGRLVQPYAGAGSSQSLKCNKTKGVPFPTSSNKPEGKAFEENRKVIWSLLMDDEVSTIGVYGMGGVGKTTLLQHIRNELLDRPDICDHVWWVTVSKDFSIHRLQDLIAKHLHLDLSSEDDDLHRAAKLSEELRQKQKWILILDDLWNSFELHDVGIHPSFKGFKLILTTRLQTVCDQIDCQHKIIVKPLLEGESWTLFKKNLSRHMALSDEVKGIAKDVARECAGLPLGIITVAGSFRRVDDPHQWRHTLKRLKDSRTGDMKVFKLLRFSYDRLGDSALQKCLRYCALFPEDHWIEREELIDYLIDEGIIKGIGRRQDAFDEGHTMLNRLQSVCLLENDKTEDGCIFVKMHDLIRDMAIQIMQEKSQVIVKPGAQLEELPNVEYWTENLKIVSLMQNSFEEIPPSQSPMCPNLSTLLLCDNGNLRLIADSFFKQFQGLKVLDLSNTSIQKLPESISDLVSLTALLLIHCWKLRDVPSLKKLMALKRLDLFETKLETMPQGMECLTNLRYLRMNARREMKFPSRVLPKLSRLQVLALDMFLITVEGREVASLRNLETLECHFKGLSDFVKYLRSRNGIRSLSTCRILVGTLKPYYLEEIDLFPSKTVLLGNLNNNADRDFPVKFLNGIQGLDCIRIDARSLCDVLSLESATELEVIRIVKCNRMESLFSSSWFCPAPLPSPSYNGIFSSLQDFYCYRCRNMKNLFPLVLLPNLANLKKIIVEECAKLEEIIGATGSDEETREFNLPKLTYLELVCLPELKGICRAKLICNSLEVIEVSRCRKLKRIPISLPLLENGQPSPHPSLKKIKVRPEEWWETMVEWEPPNAKEVLRPIVRLVERSSVLCPAYNIE